MWFLKTSVGHIIKLFKLCKRILEFCYHNREILLASKRVLYLDQNQIETTMLLKTIY